MVKPRISETDQGITGEFNTQMYDIMMRNMRDKGWIETNLIIKEGIYTGMALEIGPGPGYLGQRWWRLSAIVARLGKFFKFPSLTSFLDTTFIPDTHHELSSL